MCWIGDVDLPGRDAFTELSDELWESSDDSIDLEFFTLAGSAAVAAVYLEGRLRDAEQRDAKRRAEGLKTARVSSMREGRDRAGRDRDLVTEGGCRT